MVYYKSRLLFCLKLKLLFSFSYKGLIMDGCHNQIKHNHNRHRQANFRFPSVVKVYRMAMGNYSNRKFKYDRNLH